MKKIYIYENCTVTVNIPDNNFHERLKRSSELFMKKVLFGKSKNEGK